MFVWEKLSCAQFMHRGDSRSNLCDEASGFRIFEAGAETGNRVCFAVKRLSNGLDYLSGRTVRLDLHETNTLMEMWSGMVRN